MDIRNLIARIRRKHTTTEQLYTFNDRTLVHEPVSRSDQYIYDSSRKMVYWAPFIGIVLIAVIWYVCAYIDRMRGSYDAGLTTTCERYETTLDSLQTEMRIEHAIVRYFVDGASSTTPTVDSMMSLLVEVGAWYPEIIVAQYQLESTSGTSDLALNAHNLFGMKKVKGKRLRYTTQEKHSDYHGYGMYKNWQLSVIDRVMYDRFRFSFTKPSRDEYIRMLGGYAEDPDYQTKIDSLVSKMGKDIKG